MDLPGRETAKKVGELLEKLRFDSAFWRRVMRAGIENGPEPFVRYSPPLWGLAFWAGLPEARKIVRDNLRRVFGLRPKW